MPKTPSIAALLRKLAADKKRSGTHPCCGFVVTGPHSYDCPVEHDMSAYYS